MLALVLTMSMSVSAFASGFIPSPGAPGAGASGSGLIGSEGSQAGLPAPNDKTSPETGVKAPIAELATLVVLAGSVVTLSKKD